LSGEKTPVCCAATFGSSRGNYRGSFFVVELLKSLWAEYPIVRWGFVVAVAEFWSCVVKKMVVWWMASGGTGSLP
jgi:hypothetical protein